jgi:hypothetical protein
VNSSANDASSCASGLDVSSQFNLLLPLCIFARDTRANCLLFSTGIVTSRISCLPVVNNSCQSDEGYPGLILARSDVTLTSCVFQANMFDYFLARCCSESTKVICVECVFDQPISTTNVIMWTTTGRADEAAVTAFTDWPIPTQPPVGPDETLAAELIAGIVVAIIAGIAVRIVIRCKQVSDIPGQPPIYILEAASGTDGERVREILKDRERL